MRRFLNGNAAELMQSCCVYMYVCVCVMRGKSAGQMSGDALLSTLERKVKIKKLLPYNGTTECKYICACVCLPVYFINNGHGILV